MNQLQANSTTNIEKFMQLDTLQKTTSEITTAASKPPNDIEVDDAIRIKLHTGTAYEREDMIKCAEHLFKELRYDYDQQFKFVEKIDDFDGVFQSVTIAPNKPILVIFGNPEKRWVLFCILKDTETRILFKDPCGNNLSSELKQKIEEHFPGAKLRVQMQQDQNEDEDITYGPITLRNLQIMLKLLRGNVHNLVDTFPVTKFTKPSALEESALSEKAIKLTYELAENEEFTAAYRDFIDKFPLDYNKLVTTYRTVLKEEMSKDENKIDYKKIEAAEKRVNDEKKLNEIKNLYTMKSTTSGDPEVEILSKFPMEMEKVNELFEIIESIKFDATLNKAIGSISGILQVPEKKLIEMSKLRDKKPPVIDPVLKPDPVTWQTTVKPSKPEECTPLEQLLKELTLGKDGEETSPQAIQELERKYNLVKTKYEKWKNVATTGINNWAKSIRPNLGNTDDDICEAIAILDRGFNLTTEQLRLRDPQILSLLLFLDNKNNQGRLCQIQTGQGKTVIVSFLAVIKVLQGEKVDVITSNAILAKDGVKETRKFFSLFNLTFGTNNPTEDKICYTADILYGTISNFQFDYLREALDGYNIRRGRKFGLVILDEVDSMLVDNGGHIAKLSSPYPGMECLRYIYIKIWQELEKAHRSFVTIVKDETKRLLGRDEKQKCDDYVKKKMSSKEEFLIEKIKASNPTDVPLIPEHLKDYVSRKLDVWIKNALHAKYTCHEHKHYRIITRYQEEIVAPVDYQNTGVTMENTIWSLGLHQFVQLKHNLRLTFENLTSSFISNIGYIKKYVDKNIYGMTGTLGSRPEQDLLSNIYNIDYAKIPTYKPKIFEEFGGIVTDDAAWSTTVTMELFEQIDAGRAVLVICETENDFNTLGNILEKSDKITVKKYSNEDDVTIQNTKLKPGDVVIATNIAGRGTNFKTENELEKKGGLHVIVAFLPCNERVENQAFGRTSRQGNKGTARLIIRQSEVDKLELQENHPELKDIKKGRDRLEAKRLTLIDQVKMKEIHFNDTIFSLFCEDQAKWQKEHSEIEHRFVLQDLREFWAFWLDKKDFNAATIETTTPKEQYDIFVKDAKIILDGKIHHNPFYCLHLANYYFDRENMKEASQALQLALSLSVGTGQLAGIYMKLFEVELYKQNSFALVMSRLLILTLPSFKISFDDGSKARAVPHLKSAKTTIDTEIKYMEDHFMIVDKNHLKDFQNIIILEAEKAGKKKKDNVFLKHLNGRFSLLKIHQNNIDEMLETCKKDSNVEISGQILTNAQNAVKANFEGKPIITNFEFIDLHDIGIKCLYSLREFFDTNWRPIAGGLVKILAGIAMLAVGFFVPFTAPLALLTAETLIVDGLVDIVMELMLPGEFNLKHYLIETSTSLGISLLLFGLDKLAKFLLILEKVQKAVRSLTKFIEKAISAAETLLKSIAEKFKNMLDKIAENAEKLTNVWKEFSNAIKAVNAISSKALNHLLGTFTGRVLFKAATEVVENLVLKPLFDSAFSDAIDALKKTLIESIMNNGDLVKRMRTNPKEIIVDVANNFITSDIARDAFEQIGISLLNKANNVYVDTMVLLYQLTKNCVQFQNLKSGFTDYLDTNIKLIPGDDFDVKDTIKKICTNLAEKLSDYWYNSIKTVVSYVRSNYDDTHEEISSGKPRPPTPDAKFERLKKFLDTPVKPPTPDQKELYGILGLTVITGLTIADVITSHEKTVKNLCTNFEDAVEVMKLVTVELAFKKIIEIYDDIEYLVK